MIDLEIVDRYNLKINKLNERLEAFKLFQHNLYEIHKGDIEAYLMSMYFNDDMTSFEIRLMLAKIIEFPFDESQMSERDKNTCQKIGMAIVDILPYSKLIEKEQILN